MVEKNSMSTNRLDYYFVFQIRAIPIRVNTFLASVRCRKYFFYFICCLDCFINLPINLLHHLCCFQFAFIHQSIVASIASIYSIICYFINMLSHKYCFVLIEKTASLRFLKINVICQPDRK